MKNNILCEHIVRLFTTESRLMNHGAKNEAKLK